MAAGRVSRNEPPTNAPARGPAISRPVVALLVAPAAGKPIRPAPVVRLPVGQWEVVLANGVVGTCEVRRDGLAHEVGPLCKGTRPVVGVARRK